MDDNRQRLFRRKIEAEARWRSAVEDEKEYRGWTERQRVDETFKAYEEATATYISYIIANPAPVPAEDEIF